MKIEINNRETNIESDISKLVITLTAKMAAFLNRIEFESRTHHTTKERRSIEESSATHIPSVRLSVSLSS